MTVVNDALGIAQYICGCMNEEQAVVYLLAIERLTLQDWKTAKLLLENADPTNRQTREGTLKDIVNYFQNIAVEEEYLVKDLSILPGLSKPALELVSFNQSMLYAINLSRQQKSNQGNKTLPRDSSRTVNHVTSHQSDNIQHQVYENDNITFPYLTSQRELQTIPAAATIHAPLAPPNGWNLVVKRNQRGKKLSTVDKRKNAVVQGTNKSVNTDIKHPLKFVCLAIRSGSNETEASLQKELDKWNCLTNLKVELVRECYENSLFRVQFEVPASLHNKWRDPTVWPARMMVSEWKGNPKLELKPLTERIYVKRIYLGNISESKTKEEVIENMNHIYKEEIQQGIIQKIEAHWNEKGNKRTLQLQSQDPFREALKSACIVLTSHPGKSLTAVTLKQEHYSPRVRRTVRHWNGPTPQPTEPAKSNLSW